MFFLEEVRRVSKGKLIQGDPEQRVCGVSTNSKSVGRGELFIAIKGLRLDGHRFVGGAVRQGAGAVMVSRAIKNFPPGVGVVLVKDTVKAMGELARAYRDRFRVPVIAVTGSAGKTTTKNLIRSVLEAKYRVLASEGSENNHIGVPKTIFRLTSEHQMLVLELGTNQPGDIAWLTHIAAPTVAVFTNIGESHLELLKTPAGVFQEKLRMVKGTPPAEMIIYNGDDDFLKKIPASVRRGKFFAYGISEDNRFRISHIKPVGGQGMEFRINGKNMFRIQSPSHGNIHNAAAALACGRVLGISYKQLQKNLAAHPFTGNRQAFEKSGSITLINDSYNANPVSMRSAVETLSHLETKGRKILICADMLELGPRGGDIHRRIGEWMSRSGLNMVMTYGPLARSVSEGISTGGNGVATRHFRSLGRLHDTVKKYCRAGDVIMVKGSRGMRMERTVKFIKEWSAR